MSSRQRGRHSESGLCVDLGQPDVDQLNALIAGGKWQDLAAVVVLKPLENTLTRALQASGSNTLVVVSWSTPLNVPLVLLMLLFVVLCRVGKPSIERIQNCKCSSCEQ